MGHHHSVSAVDLQAYRSALRPLNPVYKLALSLTLLVLCVAFRNLWAALFILVSSAVLLCTAGKTPLRVYLSAMTAPLVFIILGTAAIAVEVGRAPAGDWSGRFLGLFWSASRAGLWRAAQVAATALGAISALYLQTMTTPVNEITSTLSKLRVPELLIELSYLIYRFIFVLSDAARQLRTAARSRLGYEGFRRSLHTFGTSMGTLLVVSLRQAGDYYDAMQARCYDGRLEFLEEEKKITAAQLLFGAAYLCCPVGIFLLTR